jgi:hypothetical protein
MQKATGAAGVVAVIALGWWVLRDSGKDKEIEGSAKKAKGKAERKADEAKERLFG